ncbi:formimidoylglutamase [Robertkochia sediminum]|uniref:formimidoylglutamase n=1 Tax=Robertkochia sediminum TaxID=2785326 RepID=UPI00193465A6|nr:formimidoylglutamase [Robertkochia sediminum]MBL7472968.1 formimidoylglutamase [Robertkochia sediminum]
MNTDFLSPVESVVLAHNELLPPQAIGNSIQIHSEKEGMPELEGVKMALIGVDEFRNAKVQREDHLKLKEFRRQFYRLFMGNWSQKIVDLGDLRAGDTVEDTYFALSSITADLLKRGVIPVVFGGTQDLTYAMYRAYDTMEQMVNLVTVDSKFDFGEADELISSDSYMNKIIVNPPNNLFNFSNIGYQTYCNAQEEIDLMERLFFDAYRLGEVIHDVTVVEPVFRDADLVSVDLTAVRAADLGSLPHNNPNGFDGREICAIARYAGISDKVTSFGLFECEASSQGAQLAAQLVWYFIEGVNIRKNDYPFASVDNFTKYIVPIDDMDMLFFKSNISGRWWIEVPKNQESHNNSERQTLLPCTQEEYLRATEGVVPERWWKACKKMIV